MDYARMLGDHFSNFHIVCFCWGRALPERPVIPGAGMCHIRACEESHHPLRQATKIEVTSGRAKLHQQPAILATLPTQYLLGITRKDVRFGPRLECRHSYDNIPRSAIPQSTILVLWSGSTPGPRGQPPWCGLSRVRLFKVDCGSVYLQTDMLTKKWDIDPVLLTAITSIFVGSCCKALYRKYRSHTDITVMVVRSI